MLIARAGLVLVLTAYYYWFALCVGLATIEAVL